MKKEVKLGYLSFMTPDYLYVPFDNKDSLKIPRNKNVHCGSLLGSNLNTDKIYSPASGSLIGVKSLMTSSGLRNVLIVENDFRDKRQKVVGSKRDITVYKKRETNEILNTFNLDRNFTNKKYLLINVTYDKNSDLENIFLISENVHKFLEVADALFNIFELKEVLFVINQKDNIIHDSLSKYIGSYLNLDIVNTNHDLKDSEVSKSIFGKKSNECVVYNAFEIFEIYNILKSNKVTTEKFITVYGDNIETKALLTKIGVSVEDILTIMRLKTMAKSVTLVTSESRRNIERNEAIITKEVKAIKIESSK